MSGKKPSDPSLADVLNLLKKEINLSLNCHAVGKIEVFNPATQTATATINYKKSFKKYIFGVETVVFEDYPVMIDCPCVVMSGGAFSLKMPIAPKDDCLILFNDRSLDVWFASGLTAPLDSNRMHSFSDAIILVGLRSQLKPLSGYDPTSVILGDGVHDLTLGAGEAKLEAVGSVISAGALLELANATESLGGLIDDLLTEIQSITTITPDVPAGAPITNIAAFAALALQFKALLK